MPSHSFRFIIKIVDRCHLATSWIVNDNYPRLCNFSVYISHVFIYGTCVMQRWTQILSQHILAPWRKSLSRGPTSMKLEQSGVQWTRHLTCPPSDPVSTSAAAGTEVAEVTGCHSWCLWLWTWFLWQWSVPCMSNVSAFSMLSSPGAGLRGGGAAAPHRRCPLRKNVTKIWKRKMHERVLWSIFKPRLMHANAKAQLHSGWCPAKLKWFHSITASSSLTNNAKRPTMVIVTYFASRLKFLISCSLSDFTRVPF